MKLSFFYVFTLTLGLCAALVLTCVSACATSWQATVYDTALPERVVAVDKAQQVFHLYEKRSPLTLKFTYPCTTGQVDGDKQVVNDMRTPEGVYFVDYKIANGLDFKEYGGIAYTLNYPNPVDRLRGKTGHGIWIHSKGLGIVPRDTRGCIAIGLREIEEVGPLLLPGTPVLVAERVPTEAIPTRDTGTARHLRLRMDQWTRAWAGRSAKMFDFYNAEAYTKAMPESFVAFRANKERLFKVFGWINIFNREVHVLEGPGYWVTWAEQFYRAPNLSTEGIRRLYWQKGADNQFRIVGMEWLPRNLGLQAAYLKGQFVASVDAVRSDASAEAPVAPPLTMPENMPFTAQLTQPPALSPPPTSVAPVIPFAPAAPLSATRLAPVIPAIPSSAQAPLLAAVASPPSQSPVPSVPATPRFDAVMIAQLKQRMESWRDAWQSKSPDFFAFYDEQHYGRQRDIPHRDSMVALKADMMRRFRAPWIEILQRPVTVSVVGPYYVTSAIQWIREAGRTPVQGERRLYWLVDAAGILRIVGAQWMPGEHNMQADYLESITVPVGQSIEAWRKAWETGGIDTYMDFYASGAHQQGRSRTSMREQKTRLWGTNPPAEVRLQGVRLQAASQGVRADMVQIYRDSAGRGDRGTKTLLLQPPDVSGGLWRIVQEDWTPDDTVVRSRVETH